MKTIKVKSHLRKGRVVKSHMRKSDRNLIHKSNENSRRRIRQKDYFPGTVDSMHPKTGILRSKIAQVTANRKDGYSSSHDDWGVSKSAKGKSKSIVAKRSVYNIKKSTPYKSKRKHAK